MRRSALSVMVTGVTVLALSACGGAGGTPAGSSATTTAAPSSSASSSAPPASAAADSIDDVYQAAVAEGGKLVYYTAINTKAADQLVAAFVKRFPKIDVDRVDGTGEELLARAVAERRGGAVQGDVFDSGIEDITNAKSSGLLMKWLPPEAANYPDTLKGDDWVAIEEQYWVGAWNTNLVSEADAPHGFEDFADPKWKELGLVAEPRDWMMLPALKQKYNGDEAKVIDLLTRIAANAPTFQKGHSSLDELVASGQAAACFTCYSDHFPRLRADSAPVNFFITEGIGKALGNAVLDGAPHPQAAMLWSRWIASREGQSAYAAAGRIPADPAVPPKEAVRPQTVFEVTIPDLSAKAADGRSYLDVWNEIFGLR